MRSLAVFFVFFCCGSAHTQLAIDSHYLLRFQSRLGIHLEGARDLASHRYHLFLQQDAKWQDFYSVAQVEGFAEGAYATNTRYRGEILNQESTEVSVRDLYLQWKRESLTVRAGNQQVVWGEAFGFFFADIVNPKDLREFVLADLSRSRMSSPMLMAKYVGQGWSLQGLWIPKPFLNKLPNRGGDFALPYDNLFPGMAVTYRGERILPLALSNSEVGLRATSRIWETEFSVFAFNGFDRTPALNSTITGASSVAIDRIPYRLTTIGATFSRDFGPVVARGEIIWFWDRRQTRYIAPSLSYFRSDEGLAVLGFDLNDVSPWQIGFQFSADRIVNPQSGLLSSDQRWQASARISGPVWKENQFESVLSYLPHDGSSLLQLRGTLPVSGDIEGLLGVDWLLGNSKSEFGSFRLASRAFAGIRATIGDKK